MHKPHSPSESSLYWRVFRFLDMDIRHRVTSLAELGLLPRVFGQDISGTRVDLGIIVGVFVSPSASVCQSYRWMDNANAP